MMHCLLSVQWLWKNDWQPWKFENFPRWFVFLAGLSEDGNGNILFIKADSLGEKHIMLLIPSHTNQTIKSKIERIIDRSQEPG